MLSKKARPEKLRTMSAQNMTDAYNAVIAGDMSCSQAARVFGVPRMTLNDRVKGKIDLTSKMGRPPALTIQEENSLIKYINYMLARGFPLTISQVCGFAWAIAKQEGKAEIFSPSGPSKKWWRLFKKRNPGLSLRKAESIDRGRAAMGNENTLREYFELLKGIIDENGLDKIPQSIYNCDEAAIFLNKSTQKVVVPATTKHCHSLNMGTTDHISVHCCINAAGGVIPPMIIFSKGMPGGRFVSNGPINATYSCSLSGFMDRELYTEWFEKNFLKYAVAERPLLLIQDGASSHISIQLIDLAIANDIILLCLPPSTTHITQPLDVVVYRKMKAELSKVMNQSKMLRSDLWVSKRNFASVFKIVFENTFSIALCTEAFRKCGISPFNPNAVSKEMINKTSVAPAAHEKIDLCCPAVHNTSMDQTPQSEEVDGSADQTHTSSSDMTIATLSLPVVPVLEVHDTHNTVLVEEPVRSNCTEISHACPCPPELALAAVELSLTPKKKKLYEERYSRNMTVISDSIYETWKNIKKSLKVSCKEAEPSEQVTVENVEQKSELLEVDLMNDTSPEDELVLKEPTDISVQSTDFQPRNLFDSFRLAAPAVTRAEPIQSPVNITVKFPSPDTDKRKNSNPLVEAGLISESLSSILVPPDGNLSGKTGVRLGKKKSKKARVLTTQEILEELKEKEQKKKMLEYSKQKRKEEREKKKAKADECAAKRKPKK